MAGPPRTRRLRCSVSLADAPTPPHSIEAEQAVLGGLMLDRVAWDNVADVVVADDFYRPDHRLIFEASRALAGEASPATRSRFPSTWSASASSMTPAGLLTWARSRATRQRRANVRAYADIVRERSLLRQLITRGQRNRGSRSSTTKAKRARDLVDKPSSAIFEIAEGGFARREALSPCGPVAGVIDQIDEWHNNPDKLRGLPTGFTDFDKMTGGLRPGDLRDRGRPPLDGKVHARREHGGVRGGALQHEAASVAIFSMEMPSEQVITRMLVLDRRRAAGQPPQRQAFRTKTGCASRVRPVSSLKRRSSSTRLRR